MRIRKNAKLSPLLHSHDGSASLQTTFQTHVCQLNQSSWDMISFASDSNQWEAEDSFTGNNASFGDSIGPVESVASMLHNDQKQTMLKIKDMAVDDNDTLLPPPHLSRVQKSTVSQKGDNHNKSFSCQKTDGKRWQCKNEAKPGQSFCDHHYAMLKSYSSNYNNGNGYQSKKSAPTATAVAATARRACARAASKKSSSYNPYEFYYYSGFGPSWGKRRGVRNRRNNSKIDEAKTAERASDDDDDGVRASASTVNENGNSNGQGSSSRSSSSNLSSSSQIDDYIDGDEEEEDEGGDGSRNKKRMRKPVKSRSLKSLM